MLDNEHKSRVVDRVAAVRIRAGEPYQALKNLPRTFAGIFDKSPSEPGATGFRWLNSALRLAITLSTGLSGCESEYSAEPTFCDEWCAALRHPSDCAEAPASCVRDCELTKASDDCFVHQEQLLTCYQELEPDAFSCAPPGAGSAFGDRQRVEKQACRAQRDTLFECEAPGFGECLGLCRGYQTLLTQGAVGQDVQIVPADDCPLLTQPCETICWTAFVFNSDELGRLRLPTSGLPGPSLGGAPTAPIDGGADAGAPSRDPIAALFEPCFQLGSFGETTP